jgi:hypothetical protein
VTSFSGHAPALIGPVSFSLHDEIDGTALNDLDADAASGGQSYSAEGDEEDVELGPVHYITSCRTAYNEEPGVFEGQAIMNSTASAQVCTSMRSNASGPLPDRSFTDFSFTTGAGDVSYYGEDFEKYDPGPNGDPEHVYTFSFNGETHYAFGTLVFGKNYSFALSISGPGMTKTASGTMHLPDPHVVITSQPYSCQDSIDPFWISHTCHSENSTLSIIQATASGGPD